MNHAMDSLFVPLGKSLRNRRSGEKSSVVSRPGWEVDLQLGITSTSYEQGEQIPVQHAARGLGDNVSPQFAWSEVPDETRQFAVIFEDVDSPLPGPGVHSASLVPPELREFAEGEWSTRNVAVRWVPTRAGLARGYHGPRPLPGHGRHHYRLHVLALDRAIAATTDLPNLDALDHQVAGHVIARGTLSGYLEG
ncbi:YbhB/YbcL family Raf kinase inhibitor-like protein [Micrococcales bacterium 31B]|nr:YbhB/YbcL family Raf kinase inhibitor-like protein [Micrococcales bacterium 31B]